MKVRLKNGQQDTQQRLLHHTVTNRRNPQWPYAARRLRYLHASNRSRPIGLPPQFLHERGAKVVAVTDASGGAHDPAGLDIPRLRAHVTAKGGLKGGCAKSITNEDLFRLEADYLIPAARGHAIDGTNAESVRAAYLAGRIPKKLNATASSPTEGTIAGSS